MNEATLMRRLMSVATRITGLLLIAVMAVADEKPEPTVRYEVEIILFRHLDQSRNTAEIPAATSLFTPSPLNLALPDLPASLPGNAPTTDANLLAEDALDANALLSNQPLAAETEPRLPPIGFYLLEVDPAFPDFVPLQSATLQLNSLYRRLVNIDAYEPLLHIGWIQPARSSAESIPFRIANGETDENGLSGSLTLYRERYLHIEVDLSLDSDDRPAGTPFLFGRQQELPNAYQLKESRRIRGTDVQYFDNPQFGVIARIQEINAARAERKDIG